MVKAGESSRKPRVKDKLASSALSSSQLSLTVVSQFDCSPPDQRNGAVIGRISLSNPKERLISRGHASGSQMSRLPAGVDDQRSRARKEKSILKRLSQTIAMRELHLNEIRLDNLMIQRDLASIQRMEDYYAANDEKRVSNSCEMFSSAVFWSINILQSMAKSMRRRFLQDAFQKFRERYWTRRYHFGGWPSVRHLMCYDKKTSHPAGDATTQEAKTVKEWFPAMGQNHKCLPHQRNNQIYRHVVLEIDCETSMVINRIRFDMI